MSQSRELRCILCSPFFFYSIILALAYLVDCVKVLPTWSASQVPVSGLGEVSLSFQPILSSSVESTGSCRPVHHIMRTAVNGLSRLARCRTGVEGNILDPL